MRNERGYGIVTIRSRRFFAHRISYQLAYGTIPIDKIVMHLCDYPPCCNPSHLKLGTLAENTRDAADKGLLPVGARHYTNRTPEQRLLGERHGMAILTEVQVIEIRARYATNTISQRRLATQYGVSQSHISDIVHDKKWRHLATPSSSP